MNTKLRSLLKQREEALARAANAQNPDAIGNKIHGALQEICSPVKVPQEVVHKMTGGAVAILIDHLEAEVKDLRARVKALEE